MTALIVVMALAGLAVIAWGCHARIAPAERSCAKCDYLLRSIDAHHHHCPECGADLWQEHGIQITRRESEPRLVWAGAFVCLGSVLLLSHERIGPSLATWWLRSQPTTWLQQKALDPDAASRATALTELNNRMHARRISAADWNAWLARICDLAQRQPRDVDWLPLLELLVQAKDTGQVTAAQVQAVARAVYGPPPTIAARSRIRQGAPLAFELRSPASGARNRLVRTAAVEQVRHADIDCELDPTPANSSDPATVNSGTVAINQPPGKCGIIFDVEAELLMLSAAGLSRPVARWSVPVRIDVEVVAADGVAVELIRNAELAPAVEACITVHTARLRNAATRSDVVQQFEVVIELCGSPPVPLSFEVFAQAGDWRGFIGLISSHVESPQLLSAFAERFPHQVNNVELVLEPHTRWAERTLDVDRIWGEAVIVKGVPLVRESQPE